MRGLRPGTSPVRRAAQAQAPEPSVVLCISDDQLVHLPQGIVVPTWPADAHVPRKGEVIYLTSTSAWVVAIVIHEIVRGGAVKVEVWLEWIGAARHRESDVTRWVQ